MNKQETKSTHVWDADIIKQYGNDRCTNCGMQFKYYNEGLSTLGNWSKEDIGLEEENYNKMVKRFQICVPQ